MKHKRSLSFNQIMRKSNKYRNLWRRFKENYSEDIYKPL